MSKIFALKWIHLLCFWGCSTGLSMVEFCNRGFCVTVSEHEIRAEAGLCVVIPCTYSVQSTFTPQHIVWHQCNEWGTTCLHSDIIFHSNEEKPKRRPAFIGRVSLLEPDIEKMNCSIVINDLTESDSGVYLLKVLGRYYGSSDKVHYSSKTTLKVTGLQQTPTLLIPTLTEGEQSTLTCVSPGGCSGSDPEITWIWSGPGEINSDITGNITLKNMEVTTFKQNSTLTFNPSAEHHGANITCRVKFTGNITTEKSSTVSVMYMKEIQITGDASVKEGDALNLTCTVLSFPPSQITWFKMQNGTKTDGQDDMLSGLQSINETILQEENKSVMLFISNMTKEHSGQYVCEAKHRINNLKATVDVAVIYHRRPWIVGNATVLKGRDVNLTCGADSFPPSSITWTKVGSNLTELSGQGSQSLLIPDVTTEDSGLYLCTVKYLNDTMRLRAEVTWLSEIQSDSKCELDAAGLLTCVCISEGFPLPTITWPLLRGHREHSVLTTTSNDTVSSTVTLALKHHNKTTVECISSNGNGEARGNLSIQTKLSSNEGFSEIQSDSKCELDAAGLLTCICISEGFPLPTITWPLLRGHREHSVLTKTSNYTVRSTVTLALKHHNKTTVECISNNGNGEARRNLRIQTKLSSNEGFSEIQSDSKCELDAAGLLTCICISEGFPLPTITWPLLRGRREHSVLTTTSNDTVSSTVTLALKHHNKTTVECISNNGNGEARRNLRIQTKLSSNEGFSEIQSDSKCELDAAGLLTCVCISEGFPLPTITWPLLRGHREHSVLTTTSNYTVRSTVTLALKHHNKTTVECISNNGNGEERRNLSIQTKLSSNEGHPLLQLVSKPRLIAFVIGVLWSSVIFGWGLLGCRRKEKTSKNYDGTVELTTHDDPQILGQHDGDETVEAAGSQDSNNVNNANLDFSKLRKKSPEEAARSRESTRKEYTAIKKEARDVREEEKMMMEIENETDNRSSNEEVEAVYSNVDEIMGSWGSD